MLYTLPYAATWTITRSDGNVENSPMIYAKCEYETKIKKNTFVNYKGASYTAINSDAVVLNHNNDGDGFSRVEDTSEVTYDNFTYKGAKTNTNDNWLAFNKDATITFVADKACKLYLKFHEGAVNVKVTLDGVEVTTSTEASSSQDTPYVYQISAGGKVVITSTADNTYLGCMEVEFPTE